MAYPMGESKEGYLRVDFDRRLKPEFHGSKITTDAGLLADRELDEVLGLSVGWLSRILSRRVQTQSAWEAGSQWRGCAVPLLRQSPVRDFRSGVGWYRAVH